MLADKISRGVYGRSNSYFRKRYGLLPAGDVQEAARVSYYSKELVVGVSRSALNLDYSSAIVIGGPCIDHCQGYWSKLSFQAIADCWIALVAARDLKVPCLITIEDLEQSLVSQSPYTMWRRVAERLARIISGIAQELGLEGRVRIVFTGDRDVSAALDDAVATLSSFLTERALGGMFNIKQVHMVGVKDDLLLRSYQRNVVLHLPAVATKIIGAVSVPSVIVAENLQQVKANQIVRRVNSLARLPGDVAHVVFSVTPSLSGRSRMSRSRESGKLFLIDSRERLKLKISSASMTSREYWRRICPQVPVLAVGDDESATIAETLRRVVLRGDSIAESA